MKYLPAISSIFSAVSVLVSVGVLMEARNIADRNERRSLLEQTVSTSQQTSNRKTDQGSTYEQAYRQPPSALSMGSSDPRVIYTAGMVAPPSTTEGTGPDLVGVAGVIPDSNGVNIGVQGQVSSTSNGAAGVLAQSFADTGTNYGMIATAQSPGGAAAWLGGIGGADILNTMGDVLSIDSDGNVDANSYSGDGSSLTGVTVGDGVITTSKLADGAVTTDKIGVAAVTHTQIAIGAVSSGRILDSGIANIDLANGSVRSNSIQDGSIANVDLGTGSVNSNSIQDGSIANVDLASGSVNSNSIQTGAVVNSKLGTGAVTGSKIANGAVIAEKIADGAINSEKIEDDSITADDLAPDSVTGSAILDESIQSHHYADGSIDARHLTGKNQFYERSSFGQIAPNTCETFITACDDANDLAIQGFCLGDADPDVGYGGGFGFNWADPSAAANFICDFCNYSNDDGELFSAKILCWHDPS